MPCSYWVPGEVAGRDWAKATVVCRAGQANCGVVVSQSGRREKVEYIKGLMRKLLGAGIVVFLLSQFVYHNKKCANYVRTPRVFVGVLSRSTNFEIRRAIRSSWARDDRVVVYFFMLQPSTPMLQTVRREALIYRDIVIVSDVNESYRNITYAVWEMFKRAAVRTDVTYFVKTDDDCYVRISVLLRALARLPTKWLYAGMPFESHVQPIRDPSNRWYTPFSQWPSNRSFPPYSSGMGAVISMDLVRHIATGVPHLIFPPNQLLEIEDVATGIYIDYVFRELHRPRIFARLHMNQFECAESDVITHFGWKQGIGHNTSMIANAHLCTYCYQGRCCTSQQVQNVPPHCLAHQIVDIRVPPT